MKLMAYGRPGAEKSRREKKVRRLSAAVDMGSDGGGGGEGELRSSTASPRKFKFPGKIFGDSNTVDPASVPKKLRSAIRKRSCESASVALPESKRKDCLKSNISTNGCLDHSLKQATSVSISKDEEEVAETLFALAGMIPLSDLHTKDKMDDELLEAKALEMAEKPENSMPVSTVPKEEQVTCHPASGEVAITTPVAGSSPSNSVQEKCPIGPASLNWPKLSERRLIDLNLKVSVPPVNLQTIPPLLRTFDQQQPLINSTIFHSSTEPRTDNGLNEIKQEKAFIPNSESLLRTGAVSAENQHATLAERRHNGVMSRALRDSGVYGLHLQSSAIVLPSWLSTATCSSRLGTFEDSANKLSCSMNGRRTLWKRCATHVYISCLIRVLQISEEKETQPLNTSQLRTSQGLGGSLITCDYSNSVRNNKNRMLSNTDMVSPADCENSHEGENIIPVKRRCHQEQQEGPSFSGCCGPRKQSFDFLSLSSGITPAPVNGVNRQGNNLEAGAKGHVLYKQSVAQHNISMPFSSLQNHSLPNSYRDQVAAVSVAPPPTPVQGHLQGLHYFGSPFAPGHMFNMTTSAQQPQLKQQQERQQIWTSQLAAQFRPGPLLSSDVTISQNGIKDLRSSTQMEAINPSSQPSPEELRAKYLHISQQQPQLIAIGQSLGPTRANHQHSQLPSIHEDSGSQFRHNGVLPLQVTLQ